ncbi:MAG: hypothetical protein ABIF08_02530 [Nanoarchaeota archaeon]
MKKENPVLEFVAGSGFPLENAGCMTPIFKVSEGRYFEAGSEHTFNQYVMDDLIKEEAAALFYPVDVSERFDLEELQQCDESDVYYGDNAYILYFTDLASDCIDSENLKAMGLRHQGIPVELYKPPEKLKEFHPFFLFGRESLVKGFIPELIYLCGEKIDRLLEVGDKVEDVSKYSVSGKDDPIAQLAQVMMNIATEETMEKSISCYGKTLLLSPMAKNFDVWLDFVCDHYGIDEQQIRKKYF